MAGLRNCLSEYAVHILSPCCGLLTALVLLNSVAEWCDTANLFYKNGVVLHACVHARQKDLSRGALVGFSESFCKGAKIW